MATARPSGVKYDLLLQETRPQIERNFRRPAGGRAFQRLIFTVSPHPSISSVPLAVLHPLELLARSLRGSDDHHRR